MTQSQSHPQTAAPVSDQELRQRLSELRASLQELAQELGPDSEQAQTISEALKNLEGVDASAQAFWQFAFPKAIQTGSHELTELVTATAANLDTTQRARLLIDQEEAGGCVFVDADLFEERFGQLLKCVLAGQSGSVLLHTHASAGEFSEHGEQHLTVVWTRSNHTQPAFQATIPFQLALRDMQRMGIAASQPELPSIQDCVVLRFEAAQLPGEQS